MNDFLRSKLGLSSYARLVPTTRDAFVDQRLEPIELLRSQHHVLRCPVFLQTLNAPLS